MSSNVLYDKYGKRKVYLIVCGILIIFNIILTLLAYQMNIRFTHDGERFKYLSREDDSIVFTDSEENLVHVISETYDNYFSLSSISSKYRIEYKDEIIKVDYSNFEEVELLITTSSGKEYKRRSFIFGFMDKEKEPLPIQFVYLIETTYKFVRTNNYFGLPFLAGILICLGLASLIYTEKMWRLQYIFTVKGGEPTEWATFTIKLSGILLLGIGLLLPFIAR